MSKKIKKYIVAGKGITFGPGQILALSKEQAAARMPHSVEFVKGNLYRVIKKTDFKNGEEIGVIGDAPKALFEALKEKSKKKTAPSATEAENENAEETGEEGDSKTSEKDNDSESANDTESEEVDEDETMSLEDAIDSLNPENPEHWTQGGLPNLNVLKDLTGNGEIKREDIEQAAPEYTRETAAEAEGEA